MLIAVLADEELKAEILGKNSTKDGIEYIWPDSLSSLLMVEADYYFDLKFEMDVERISKLRALLPKTVLIGGVNDNLATIGDDRFIRINSWPGMLEREIIELAFTDQLLSRVESLAEKLGWQYIRVPDLPGMVTPRVIAMIVNEAFFALEEGLSSRSEIDIAMRLGTSYPYGPFEWAAKVGAGKILRLLRSLQVRNNRYEISAELVKEVNSTDPVFANK
ncbi:3-hydroxyacyl-CoA dehydrogenase family protein [Flavitalea sp.]|nr:3-hydroxyacyl-CoA dehydrogenase family protein [Flavitalea sp.]